MSANQCNAMELKEAAMRPVRHPNVIHRLEEFVGALIDLRMDMLEI